MAETAREAILKRVRSAIAPPAADPAAGWAAIRREYRTGGNADLLHLLEDRLHDYDAGVYRVPADGVRDRIAEVLASRSKRRMALAPGFPGTWLPDGVDFFTDAAGSVQPLDKSDGVLTTATLAIAETGTIVLQDVAGQGRRALTLVPDYHLCLVRAADIVGTVPEAFARLAATATLATTFFSGPSATADIEMTRIKGVHGPRFVDVIVVL